MLSYASISEVPISSLPVAASELSLTLPAVSHSNVLYAPTVAPGAVTITLPFISSQNVLYAITVVGSDQDLTLPLIASTTVLYAPSISHTVFLPSISSTTALYGMTMNPGPVAILLPFFPVGQIYLPTIIPTILQAPDEEQGQFNRQAVRSGDLSEAVVGEQGTFVRATSSSGSLEEIEVV